MTVLTAAAGADGRAGSRESGFRVDFTRDCKRAKARWGDPAGATPFQDWQWLEAWYGAFANVDHLEPLIAIVSSAATGEQAMLLPLIRRLHNGMRIVEPADLDLTDYNAPLLGPAAPRDAKAARAMWQD
jgi:CelD/BcsL family acetyltransferase involved in cellulose biosynthesis